MITQIYAIQTAEEAIKAIEAGADYLGMLPVIGDRVPVAGCGEISDKAMKEIMLSTKGKCIRVALSISNDPEYFMAMAREYRPEIIHLSGTEFHINKEFRNIFKAEFPEIKLLQAVTVGYDRIAVEQAKEYAKWADILILDTLNQELEGVVGASGKEHDRNIDKEIIDSVDIPVIVAGGLDENNVLEIIEKTKPFGVDTMTRTNRIIDGRRTMFKDFDKLRVFCEKAHSAV
jgi:phosphoribosylanthranilate isomerase